MTDATLTSKTVTFDALPLGARFRYPGKNDVWVKLENGGCGVVAEWSDPQLNWPGQGIYSFADSEQQRASGLVEWIDRASDETFPRRSVESLETWPGDHDAKAPVPVQPVLGTAQEITDKSLAFLIRFARNSHDYLAFVELWERRGELKAAEPPCICLKPFNEKPGPHHSLKCSRYRP